MTNPLHTAFWYFSSLLATSARGRESATSSIRLWYTDCLYFLVYLQRFRAGECSDDNPDWHESADSSETQKIRSLANIQQVITMITRPRSIIPRLPRSSVQSTVSKEITQNRVKLGPRCRSTASRLYNPCSLNAEVRNIT